MRALRTTPSRQPAPAHEPTPAESCGLAPSVRSPDAEPAADFSAFRRAVPGEAGGSRIHAPFRGPLVLFAASLVLLAAGVVFLVLSGSRPAPATGNQALTNAAETGQVTAAVRAGVAGIYSYSYTDLAATTRTAHEVLTGQAAAQYAELSGMLSSAVTEKLTVVTKVTAIGVRSLTGHTATLLVFLQQATTRDAKPAGTVPAQLQVTADLVGGRWLIAGITAR
jgi:Mce-associated membrane protein